MLGVSYGGISQLFVAKTRPPSLAAITPLSVIDATQTTLYPGGVLNTGFALEWAMDRVDDSQPASPTTGQSWAWERIEEGDEICKENQQLHPEAVNLLGKIQRNQYYKPKVADPLAPVTFVHKIDVPVFMACQWTDEQTGGHCPTLAAQFTGTDRKWFTFTNGVHTDSLDPETFNRWYDFMELYVAQRKPKENPAMAAAPVLYAGRDGRPRRHPPARPDPGRARLRLGAGGVRGPAARCGSCSTTAPAATSPAIPCPAFEQSFAKLAGAGDEGALVLPRRRRRAARQGARPRAARTRSVATPAARPPTDFTGDTGGGAGRALDRDPAIRLDAEPGRDRGLLRHRAAGRGHDRARRRRAQGLDPLVGPATSTCRRPSPRSGPTARRPSCRAAGCAADLAQARPRRRAPSSSRCSACASATAGPLPRGEWTKVTVPLYYQGHVYRAGSAIRVTISAVGGDQPIWAFAEAKPSDSAKVTIAHSEEMPSKLLLPVVARGRRADRPAALPGPARRALPRLRAVREPERAAALTDDERPAQRRAKRAARALAMRGHPRVRLPNSNFTRWVAPLFSRLHFVRQSSSPSCSSEQRHPL